MPSITRERRITPKSSDQFFRTPPEATQALLAKEMFTPVVLEPACGDGAMSRVLQAAGHEVHSSDLVDRGYGLGGIDFLSMRRDQIAPCEFSVVTNPPFKLLGEFAEHALALGARKVALFGRVAALEGKKRHATLYGPGRLSRVWVLSSRVTLWAGDLEQPEEIKGGAMAFAWFVFAPGHPGTTLGWI